VGNKVYKYIQYSEEAAATDGVAGEVCYYVDDSGYPAHEVTSDVSAAGGDAAIGAGVLQAIMSDAQYGWIQIKGMATLTIALVAGTDGQPLTTFGLTTNDGSLDLAASVADNVCAIAIDSTAKQIVCDFPF
jgi:hypothetical protein